jgi:hypothetical protein
VTTAAILCIARNETPFIEEWARHHLALGFDRIYHVSTDDDPLTAERAIDAAGLGPRVRFLHFDDFRPGWQIRCYNAHLPLVREDWILVLDVDEFVDLHPFDSIHDLVATIPADVGQVQFPWVLKIPSGYSRDSVLGGAPGDASHVSDHVKSMVRRDATTWLGIHAHDPGGTRTVLSNGDPVPGGSRRPELLAGAGHDGPVVLHFASRGHLDVMIRIADHRFFDSKSGDRERSRLARFLVEPASWASIPTRCLLLQYYRSLPVADRRPPVPVVGARTNLDALRSSFLSRINRLVEFGCTEPGAIEEAFESRYRYAMKLTALRRLAELNGSAGADLDEYLGHATQDGYIDKLRVALTAEREA